MRMYVFICILLCSISGFSSAIEGSLVGVGPSDFNDLGASILFEHPFGEKNTIGLNFMRLGGLSAEPESLETRSQYYGISGRHYLNSYNSDGTFFGLVMGYGERKFRISDHRKESFGLFIAPEAGYRWVFDERFSLGASAQFVFSNLAKDFSYSYPSSSGQTSASDSLNLKLNIGFIF